MTDVGLISDKAQNLILLIANRYYIFSKLTVICVDLSKTVEI